MDASGTGPILFHFGILDLQECFGYAIGMAQPPLPVQQPGNYGLQQTQGQRTPVARGKAAAFDAYLAQGGTTFRKSGRFKKGKHRGKSYDEVKAEFERMWATAPDAVKDKYASRALETDLSPSEKKAFEAGNPTVTQQPQYPQGYPPQAQGQLPAQQPNIGTPQNPAGVPGAFTDPAQPWNYTADPNQPVQAVGTDANGDGQVNNADAAATAAAPRDANNQPMLPAQRPRLRGENYSLAQDGRLAPMKPRGESPFPVSQPGSPAPVATQDASRDPATPDESSAESSALNPSILAPNAFENARPMTGEAGSAQAYRRSEGTPLDNAIDDTYNTLKRVGEDNIKSIKGAVMAPFTPESESTVNSEIQARETAATKQAQEEAQLAQRRLVAENTAKALADAGLPPDPNAETFPAPPVNRPQGDMTNPAVNPSYDPAAAAKMQAQLDAIPAPPAGQEYTGPPVAPGIEGYNAIPSPAQSPAAPLGTAPTAAPGAPPSPVAKPRAINKATGLPFGYRPGDNLNGMDQGVQQLGKESIAAQEMARRKAAANQTLGQMESPMSPVQRPMPRGPASQPPVSGERQVSQATRDYVAKTKQGFAEVGAVNRSARELTEDAVAKYGSVEAAPLPVQWGVPQTQKSEAPRGVVPNQLPAKKPFYTGSPIVARPSAQFSRVRMGR